VADSRYTVIVTGTDPDSRAGGIGFALPGYLAALAAAGVRYEVLPTYRPGGFTGSWLPWLGALGRLAWRIPVRRRRGELLAVYSHTGAGVSLLREGIVLRLARALGACTVMQLHCRAAEHYLASTWRAALFRSAVAGADQLWVLTPWWRDLLQRHRVDAVLRVVPNPLPPQWCDRARRPREQHDGNAEIMVLAMARIEPGKGVDLLVEAMGYLPGHFRLVVAGDGSQSVAVRARAAELGLSDRVVFTGWVQGADKQRLLDEADLFCLPSTNDSFGLGFVEAMANGLPVVALDWGPVADVVPDGVAGALAKEWTPQALARAIAALEDAPLRRRLGTQGQRWVLEQYAPEVVAGHIRDLLDALLDAPAEPRRV